MIAPAIERSADHTCQRAHSQLDQCDAVVSAWTWPPSFFHQIRIDDKRQGDGERPDSEDPDATTETHRNGVLSSRPDDLGTSRNIQIKRRPGPPWEPQGADAGCSRGHFVDLLNEWRAPKARDI